MRQRSQVRSSPAAVVGVVEGEGDDAEHVGDPVTGERVEPLDDRGTEPGRRLVVADLVPGDLVAVLVVHGSFPRLGELELIGVVAIGLDRPERQRSAADAAGDRVLNQVPNLL